MKKICSMLLLVAAIFASLPTQAQTRFGVKAGYNVSKIKFSEEVFDGSNRGGWFIGPMVKFTFPIVGLSMDAAALYDQRTSKVSNVNAETGSSTIKQQTIDIPINVRYGLGMSSVANVYLFAGPQFAFNVGDDTFQWNSASTYSNTFQLRKSTISVNVGAGVTLLTHLQLSVNYNIACGKTGDATVLNTVTHAVENSVKGHNNSWQIAATYYF